MHVIASGRRSRVDLEVAGVESRGRAIALLYSLIASDLRLRFRHLTISDITRLAAHAAVGSRFLGRLEQRAAPQHERQHGRRDQQLLVRLRRG